MAIEAQKIACVNHAGFVMSFVAQTNGARSYPTGNYPINQTEMIDLASTSFRENLEFWPEVHAVLGKTQSADEHIVFKMNGQTATYEVRGTTLDYSVKLVGYSDPDRLPDFPADIPLNRYPFKNWAGDISLSNVWTCAPLNPQQVADVCNWAKDHGYRVRARGYMHTWSPLTVIPHQDDKVLLMDMTKSLFQKTFIPASNGQAARVRVGTGSSMNDLLSFLEQQAGGKGSAPGYSFPHTPAPGDLTVGGVLAINGHGTAVAAVGESPVPSGYGSMSNRILEFTAVVTIPNSSQPNQYVLKTFKREEEDSKAFLTHLGRAIIVEVVLEVVDNYNLRCISRTDLSEDVIFSRNKTADSFADFLDRYGRVEIIWFPFTTNPWLHLWELAPHKPAEARQVNSPFNYQFADDLDPSIRSFLRSHGKDMGIFTPTFGKMMYEATHKGLDGENLIGMKVYPSSRDIWGPSKNTLLYIKPSTLQVTANGYAVHMQRENVQGAVFSFTRKFLELLAQYQAAGKYPVNSALEIRVTGLDDPAALNSSPAQSPVISSLRYDELAQKNAWDTALWLDVLTIPDTPHANEFYQELETWLLDNFSLSNGYRILPEWSKGWAYTSDGPWTNQEYINQVSNLFTMQTGKNNNWNWQVETLSKYDSCGLFSNPFLSKLFAPV